MRTSGGARISTRIKFTDIEEYREKLMRGSTGGLSPEGSLAREQLRRLIEQAIERLPDALNAAQRPEPKVEMRWCSARSWGLRGPPCVSKYEGAPKNRQLQVRTDGHRDHVFGALLA